MCCVVNNVSSKPSKSSTSYMFTKKKKTIPTVNVVDELASPLKLSPVNNISVKMCHKSQEQSSNKHFLKLISQ